jgi:hypothetical protein
MQPREVRFHSSFSFVFDRQYRDACGARTSRIPKGKLQTRKAKPSIFLEHARDTPVFRQLPKYRHSSRALVWRIQNRSEGATQPETGAQSPLRLPVKTIG